MTQAGYPSPGARVFCIGRNYADHAREMRADLPERPVIFMKPPSSCRPPGEVAFPSGHGRVNFEGELVAVLSGDPRDPVAGAALGVDLTLRELQAELKEKRLPWTVAKAFDGSALLGPVTPLDAAAFNELEFHVRVNGRPRQHGLAGNMIFSCDEIIAELTRYWKPESGDLLFTGTPEGVGPVHPGDLITMESPQLGGVEWRLS